MSRQSLPAIGLSSLLLASHVGALELGSIRVLSAEDEPFKADIELTDVGQLKPIDIAVALASEVEYQQARIEREPFLNQLSYDVILNGRDGGVIHVSGPVAIPQDDWQMLLEARWPNGRRLKQFMVQNDQQSFAQSTAPAVLPNQAVVEEPQLNQEPQLNPEPQLASEPEELVFEDSELPTPDDVNVEPQVARPEPELIANEAPEPVNEEDDAVEAEPEMEAPMAAQPEDETLDTSASDIASNSYSSANSFQEETYTTERGDVLWRIANRVRPTDEVNIYQTLLALQQLNPQAFVNANVNRLKVGQVLRLPTDADVRANSPAHARQEIAEQIRVWEEEKGIVRQLDARPEQPTEISNSGNSAPSLSLSTSNGYSTNNSDSTDADVAEISKRLEAALSQLEVAQRNSASLNEELASKNETVTELRNKLAVLNEQLASLQSKLTSDEEFTELKSQLDAGEDTQGETEEAASTIEETSVESNDSGSEMDSSVSGDEEELEFEQAVDPESEFEEVSNEPTGDVPATEQETAETGLLESFKGWKGIALIGGLIAAAGLFFAARRRKEEDEYVEEEFDLPEERQVPPPAESNSFDASEPFDDTESDAEIDDADAFVAGELTEEEETENELITEGDEGGNDPLKEADIYLAYGRHPEAADLLEKAIAEDPENIDLLQKLVEVHTAAGDEESASDTLDRMVALQSDDFVEPATEEELDIFEELSDLDDDAQDELVDDFPDLEDVSSLNTVLGDDSTSGAGETLVDDVLADLELDLGDDLDDADSATETTPAATMDLEDLQIPDELAADHDDYDDEVEHLAELDSDVSTFSEADESSFDELMSSSDEVEDGETTTESEEQFEDSEYVLANYEISLQSAEQLIAEGKPSAARTILEAMMSSGTALQKQQAKEMLLDLG